MDPLSGAIAKVLVPIAVLAVILIAGIALGRAQVKRKVQEDQNEFQQDFIEAPELTKRAYLKRLRKLVRNRTEVPRDHGGASGGSAG